MFLDTSVIIEIIRSGPDSPRLRRIFEALGAGPFYVSVAQVAEIADWCRARGFDAEEIVSGVSGVVEIAPLSGQICMEAAKVKAEMRRKGVPRFGLMDGIVLASAWSLDEKLLTLDPDFRKAADAVVIA